MKDALKPRYPTDLVPKPEKGRMPSSAGYWVLKCLDPGIRPNSESRRFAIRSTNMGGYRGLSV